MSKPTREELEKILSDTGLDNILLFNIDGELIESNDFDYDSNYAAMSGIISTMCKEMIEDLEYGKMEKIIIHADNGLVMIQKLDVDGYLATFTKDGSKLGLLMKTMNSILKK